MSSIAQRMIFGFKDGKVTKFPVEINWDLGWSAADKLEYISRVKNYAEEKYGIIDALDVTTANRSYERGSTLSPHILRYTGTSIPVWDYYKEKAKDKINPPYNHYAFAYYYMYSIFHSNAYGLLRRYDHYFDVFWKPGNGGTQAEECAIMRIIIEQKLHKDFFGTLDGSKGFIEWYENFQENK